MEGEWLTTLSHVDPEDVRYIDFVEEGERLAAELRVRLPAGFRRLGVHPAVSCPSAALLLLPLTATSCPARLQAQGAEVVIALTHMRLPNDLRLAQSAPGIDLVLGGHVRHCHFLGCT